MKKYILLLIITIGIVNATEYRLTHLSRGTKLNVRMEPIVNYKTAIGYLPYNAIGIKIRECKYNKYGQEWCYINYPIGGEHIEGWVSRRFLKPMSNKDTTSILYIKNFLKNFYKADEENFLDKLQVFYRFPMQQYFYYKNLSLMQLRTQKVLFYKKWFKRNFNMTHLKILRRRKNYIDVQATVRWRLKNWKDEQTGKDIQKVRLVRDNGKFKVLAIKNLRHFVDSKVIEAKENNDTNLTVPLSDKGIHFYIKIGSFFSNPNKEYLAKVSTNNFNYIIKNAIQDGHTIKRLYIGPYTTEDEAIKELSRVRLKINKNAYIQSF